MANTNDPGYDTSVGTNERSAVAATKIWAIVLGIVFLAGLIIISMFLLGGTDNRPSSGPVSSENTASRPAEP